MTDADVLLSQFIDAWNRGERPDVDTYLERASEDTRDDLADQIGFFLLHAPTPIYSDEARAAIRSHPAVQQVMGALDGEAGLWPLLLPRLRDRARLRRDEVVAKLSEALGIQGKEAKTRRYLHDMEIGALDPRGVSQKVLDALGSILGVSGDELARAGDFPTLGGGPVPAAAYYRARLVEEEMLDVAPALATPGTEDEPDEVDRLFTGGR